MVVNSNPIDIMSLYNWLAQKKKQKNYLDLCLNTQLDIKVVTEFVIKVHFRKL